jgi:hypothetical protein
MSRFGAYVPLDRAVISYPYLRLDRHCDLCMV